MNKQKIITKIFEEYVYEFNLLYNYFFELDRKPYHQIGSMDVHLSEINGIGFACFLIYEKMEVMLDEYDFLTETYDINYEGQESYLRKHIKEYIYKQIKEFDDHKTHIRKQLIIKMIENKIKAYL